MIKIYVTIVFILSNPVMVIDVLLHARRIIRPGRPPKFYFIIILVAIRAVPLESGTSERL